MLARIDARLAPADALLERAYPGDDGSRQPVHTVYVPADRFHAGLAREWGEVARAAVEAAGGIDALLEACAVPPGERERVGSQVLAKLAREPVEDLRVDFEDGYGDHGAAEDDDAVAAARVLRDEAAHGGGTPFVGIRFKSLERPTRRRGLRTLDLVLATLLADGGTLPAGFVVTLPKVTSVDQVSVMVAVCDALERAHGLAPGLLRFELQVETPQAVLGSDGTALVARMVHAGRGRVAGLHYGTFDYSASVGIAAAYQSPEHPAADHAKAVMQVAAAGTGVRLSDGSTNVLPVGTPAQVRAAWALHARLVRRALERGYYQGWDMHPAHLPSRYAATYAFFRAGFDAAADRLRDYLARTEGAVMDEPATAKALAGFLRRGLDCGAVTADELEQRAGVTPGDLTRLLRRPPSASSA
ncbi:DUF6986 family protein [Cellulomonas fimi]|uniref:Aldolase n=1 Tax=Cellulomonas fimi TaxID=1708 RepID=A0A7Y0LYT0_CELFI|nr:aldolase/citrate lyase family protein [Cellulomonas fimi]NMR20678.1 aldolase [Cellulomonas fimi]